MLVYGKSCVRSVKPGTGSKPGSNSPDAGRRRIPPGVFCFQNINFIPRILVFLNWNRYKQNSSKKLRTRILVGTSIVSIYFSTKLIIHNWTAQNHWATVIQKIMERFLVESRKYSSFALGSLYFVLWLGHSNTRATFSANDNQNQERLLRVYFPALAVAAAFKTM